MRAEKAGIHERIMMMAPLCFDCRFFVPEGKLHNDLTEDQWMKRWQAIAAVIVPLR